MVWVILAALGVPLWLCAMGIGLMLVRNRRLRTRPGNVPVRLRTAPGHRWRRGHAVWVHDVFAFRASPASWAQSLSQVTAATIRAPVGTEARHLRRLEHPVIAEFTVGDVALQVATSGASSTALLGPHGPGAGGNGKETGIVGIDSPVLEAATSAN